MPTFVESISLGQALTWLGMVGIVVAWISMVMPQLRAIMHALDDLRGEEARPGFDARPGVFERIKAVEDGHADIRQTLTEQGKVLAEQGEVLADIQHHVKPNSGSSSYDALLREIKAVRAVAEDTSQRMDASEADRRSIWARLDRPKSRSIFRL